MENPRDVLHTNPKLLRRGKRMRDLSAEINDLLVQHDRWIGSRAEFSHYQGWLLDAGLMLLINVVMWLFSLVIGKCWPADLVRSLSPGIMAVHILYRSPLKFVSPKQWLFLAVVWFWALRMTLNFLSRGGIGGEDWRYTEMRDTVGKRWFPLLSLPMVFLGQGFFNFLGCLSLYGMLRNRFSMVSAIDIVGIALCVAGVVIETAADEQMDQFQKKARLKETEDDTLEVLDKGLWAFSRHPNYFGECLFWVGLWVCASCELGPALFGPILMISLFFGVSIPLMEERQLERRGEQYERYQRRVPSSFFLIPPIIARIIWPGISEGDEGEQGQDEPGQEQDAAMAETEEEQEQVDLEPPPTVESKKKQ